MGEYEEFKHKVGTVLHAIPAPGRLGQEDCYEFEASLRSAEENTDYALRKNHQNFTTAKK